jgi:hypothetical protein
MGGPPKQIFELPKDVPMYENANGRIFSWFTEHNLWDGVLEEKMA